MKDSYKTNSSAMENKGFYDEHGSYIKAEYPEKNGHQNGAYVPDTKNVSDTKISIVDRPVEEEDVWKVANLSEDYVHWHQLDRKGKIHRVFDYSIRVVAVLCILYLFICSLDFLSSAFKLLGGEAAGKVFQQSDIFTNPIAGLMMGVLVTVLVQSSSTSTSIVVSMVGGGLLDIETAIPIIMGANIGTSVTNTIVAMGQIHNKAEFRRAFAGATVHDMFNWLCVIVLLPLEVITGFLYRISGAIIDPYRNDEKFKQGDKSANKDILKVITKPFTNLIIQVNKDAITQIAKDEAEDVPIMKLCCDKTTPATCCSNNLKAFKKLPEFAFLSTDASYSDADKLKVCNATKMLQCVNRDVSTSAPGDCLTGAWAYKDIDHSREVDWLDCSAWGVNCNGTLADWAQNGLITAGTMNSTDYTARCADLSTQHANMTNFTVSACATSWSTSTFTWAAQSDVFDCGNWTKEVEQNECNKECSYLFRGLYPALTDIQIGAILLIVSLIILCVCLVLMVKILHSLLKGPIAVLIKKFVNYSPEGCFGHFIGYIAILVGAGLTIVVQSSSIFTSTLTPLVGMGVIEIDRMYPLTLGSNIGTTTTAILSALANSGDKLLDSLQVALCHLFFNIAGILLFYPFPFTRIPIPMAKFLGTTTAKYRWFALVYIIAMFFLFPMIVFGLSIPGWYVMVAVMGPVALLCIIVALVKLMQHRCKGALPHWLHDFKWLPLACRSLAPYDRCIKKLHCKAFEDDGQAEPSSQKMRDTKM